ncbi:class I SAM-dependent methyltransferase [Microvirga pakistanensis]|uniref:class I SAM-dependent methyltransferase n=1 Tax=Microvirga pakistanensis TaxID=1682650 RepID=UPI00106AB619|nr:class I SAM-dependent methyltransferase [Microvirga pakistanensis]
MKVWKSLGLKFRKRIPSFAKRWVRLARHAMAAPAQASHRLPPELLTECRVCASRYELLKHLPRKARVAEIGVEHGRFSQHILSVTDPSEFHLVDLDFGALSPELRRDPRVSIRQGYSHEVLNSFADDSFDWIYIDADHSYEGVKRDANAAAAKVRPGGFLIFNDFAHVDPFLGRYGVHRAVVEFAIARKWPFVWLAYEPHGLYDVALQRPAGSIVH